MESNQIKSIQKIMVRMDDGCYVFIINRCCTALGRYSTWMHPYLHMQPLSVEKASRARPVERDSAVNSVIKTISHPRIGSRIANCATHSTTEHWQEDVLGIN